MSYRLEGIDPFGVDVELDAGIMDALPPGSRVISTSRSGQSLWVETVRIDVELPDGTEQAFFKKGASGDLGLAMMKGSFESEKALHDYIPEFVPRPIAYGSYKSLTDTHFYLAEFVEMEEAPPEAHAWANAVSSLHRRSMGKSPGGKFGFHGTGLAESAGKEDPVELDSNLERVLGEVFTQQLHSMCEIEESRREYNADYLRLKKAFFDIVIPRYIGALEANRRKVHPVLLHNDIWPQNVKPKTEDPETVCLFDSAACWGHNEVDARSTRPGLWNLEKAGDIYREIMGVSDPQDDYSTRLDVYSILGCVLRSAMYEGEPKRRVMTMELMQTLVDRALLAPTIHTLGGGNLEDITEDESTKPLEHMAQASPWAVSTSIHAVGV